MTSDDLAVNSFLMELDDRWVLWELGQDALAFCALEDVGEIAAPGAERYDGENWYRGTPPFEAPGAPATARESSRSKKAIGQRPTETGSEGAVLGSSSTGGPPARASVVAAMDAGASASASVITTSGRRVRSICARSVVASASSRETRTAPVSSPRALRVRVSSRPRRPR